MILFDIDDENRMYECSMSGCHPDKGMRKVMMASTIL